MKFSDFFAGRSVDCICCRLAVEDVLLTGNLSSDQHISIASNRKQKFECRDLDTESL